jgi:branched-chain amino acid transport system substrate-binding protein
VCPGGLARFRDPGGEELIMRVASRLAVVLSVGAVALSAAACGADNGGSAAEDGGSGNTATPREGVTKDTIKYGLIYDQTGAQSVAQQPWANGVITQLEKANDAGGINGRQIEILQEDDKSEVPVGIAAYKKLFSQTPVVGITGINNSSIQEAALPQVRKDKMPLVGPQSTTKAGLVPFNETAFYVIPPYSDQVDVIMSYMTEKLSKPQPKVAVFRLIAASGIEVDELVKARVADMGGEIVADEEIDPTATTADAQVQKIVAANPDFIVFHTSPTLSTLALKGLQKLNAKIPVISTFAGGGPVPYQSVPKEFGSLMEYTSAFTPADIEVPGTADLVADAEKYGYGEDATNSQYVIGYIVGQVVVEGLTKAGADLSRETYVKALEGIQDLDTGGLSEPVTYGPDDRSGISETRPFTYNYDTKKFEAIGELSDYADAITHEYGGG